MLTGLNLTGTAMRPLQTVFSAAAPAVPLALRFAQARGQTERLFEPLSAHVCQLQSIRGASPAKWHLAHLSRFFRRFFAGALQPAIFSPETAQ